LWKKDKDHHQIIHNGRSACTTHSSEAQLLQRVRINLSSRVLKAPRSTVFDTAVALGVCGAGVGRGRRRAVGRMWGAIRRAWWRMRAHEGVWWGARGARYRREWAAARVGEDSEGDCHLSSVGARGACAPYRDCSLGLRSRSTGLLPGCAPAVRAWRGRLRGV
jgi:hypothetical protein